ncbi:MAG: YkvA family protein [Chloroflexota bacterium]
MIQSLRQRARYLKSWSFALYLAYRDPRVPLHARLFALCVVAYAFSPIDLVPDFVPILGYLDDLVLIPIGISLAMRMIPRPVLDECRQRAETAMAEGKPTNWVAAGVIVAIWLLFAALGVTLAMRAFS